jgi:hypothetical protein
VFSIPTEPTSAGGSSDKPFHLTGGLRHPPPCFHAITIHMNLTEDSA